MTHENLLNVFGFSWSVLLGFDYISWGLGVATGVTLIWMNIERALKARKERKNDNTENDQEN